ncbi:hypothetical protein EDD15DRAFT_1927013 [Pisolithus albus]|nr:hypothetical protein EDD15DRAFT_1927013 [Pisolithus albus]
MPYDQVSDSVLEADILGDDIRLSEEHISSSKTTVAFPENTLVEHVPGWTVFRDIYMFIGTLLIVSSSPSSFPGIRYMTSTGLAADVTPENIAARKPSKWNIGFPESRTSGSALGDDCRESKDYVHRGQHVSVQQSPAIPCTLLTLLALNFYYLPSLSGLEQLTQSLHHLYIVPSSRSRRLLDGETIQGSTGDLY